MAGKIRFPMISDESTHARNNHSTGVGEDDADDREKTPEPDIDWEDVSPNAPGSRYTGHKAIYPPDSILEDYMDYVRVECESADAFIIGSILPICAAQLGRNVRFPWGSNVRFPNLFSMLAGPAGDRKSSAIEIARA